MSWFNTSGHEDIHTLWSRFRFYRNISGMSFYDRADPKKLSSVMSDTDKTLEKNGFHKNTSADRISMLSYSEKQYTEESFIDSVLPHALYFNEPCSLSISVGGRDFFCIQSVLCGLCADECYNIASEAELLLDSEFDLAYSEKFGYLSPIPAHTGQGIEISAALFLPALAKKNKIEGLKNILCRSSIELYPMVTYESNPGDLYILNYIPKSGMGEETSVTYFHNIAEYIISYEKEYEHSVYGDNITELSDPARRAFGTMEYAGKIDEFEFLCLFSDLRLCLATGANKDDKILGKMSVRDLNGILAQSLSASLIANAGVKPLNIGECNSLRANILKDFAVSLKESV